MATDRSPGDRPAYCAGEMSAVVDRFLARIGQLERRGAGNSSLQGHNCPCDSGVGERSSEGPARVCG